MIRKAIVFIFLNCFLQTAYPAVIREQFARTVDYIGWQIIDAYMQDYLSIRPNQTAEQEGYDAFRQEFGRDQYSIEQPPNSEAVATFLEGHAWRNATNNLYRRIVDMKTTYRNEWTEAEAIDFLQQQIQNISLQPLGVSSEEAYEQLLQTKALLKQEVKQHLTTEVATSAPAEDSSQAEVIATPLQAGEQEVAATGALAESPLHYFSNPLYTLILLGLTIISLALLWYAFSLLRKQDSRIDRHSKRIEELTVRTFQKTSPYVTREEIAQLKNRLKEAEAQVASIRQQVAKKEKSGASRNPKAHRPPPVTISYYLSTPNSDGTFPAGSMSTQFRPSASVYHFLVDEENGETTAEFTVANNAEAMKDALSSPGSYLEPVCDSSNSYFPGAQRIVNVKPGKALRRGDQWVVLPEDKALIRYE